ncbi:MAG: hypothetical protein WD042_13990 [Phycisphaeraceae bacterium]
MAALSSVWCRWHTRLHTDCAGSNPFWRIAVLVWMLYLAVRYLLTPEHMSVISWISVALHEAGHFITGVCLPLPVVVAAGTLFQWAAPLAVAAHFVRQRDWFAVSLSGVWLAISLYLSAPYIADARAQALPMARPFGIDVDIHDWDYMLGGLGLLRWDATLARAVALAAFVVMWTSILGGSYIVVLMLRSWWRQRVGTGQRES